MKDIAKVKNISVPDYRKEWLKEFQNKKQEIIETVKNAETISLVRTMNPSLEALHALIRKDYKPELLTINDSIIKSRYYSKDLITTVLNNLNSDTTTLKIMPQLLSDPNFINNLRKCNNLTSLEILIDYEITKEQLNDILRKTNLYIINIPHPSKIDITGLPTAIKYDGDFEAIYYDGLLIENQRRFNSNYHFFYTDDVAYNIEDIFNFFIHNKLSNDENMKLNIISNDGLDSIHYSKKTASLEYYGRFSDLKNVISEFESAELPLDTIYIGLENKDYDFRDLYSINKNIKLIYEGNETTIEEFEAMRSTIDYFKSLITAYPLSPVEQIVYAYDIIKSFEYEDDEEDYRNSRHLDKIVKTGKIVCVGYARFLKQVLSELGFKIDVIGVKSPNPDGTYDNTRVNHERILIRVDDDKYNIHGVFALDPTWDRNTIHYEVKGKDGDYTHPVEDPRDNVILKEYSAIISYIHFLVTKNEYQHLFADEYAPSIFKFEPNSLVEQLKKKPKFSGRVKNKITEAMCYLQEFFDEDEYDQIPSYLNTERPSLDIMKEILYNVEKAEGYTREATEQTLRDMEEYNRSLHEYDGTPVFKSESTAPEDNWIIRK